MSTSTAITTSPTTTTKSKNKNNNKNVNKDSKNIISPSNFRSELDDERKWLFLIFRLVQLPMFVAAISHLRIRRKESRRVVADEAGVDDQLSVLDFDYSAGRSRHVGLLDDADFHSQISGLKNYFFKCARIVGTPGVEYEMFFSKQYD